MLVKSVSVNTEILKESLSPAGNINGIGSYYCYKDNIKKNYTFNIIATQDEIDSYYKDITYWGYNSGTFEYSVNGSSGKIDGNIVNVSTSDPIYIDGETYYNATLSIVSYPEEGIYETYTELTIDGNLSIAGYLANGDLYLSGTTTSKNYFIRKTYSEEILAGSISSSSPAGPSGAGGSSGSPGGGILANIKSSNNGTLDSITLSKTPSNYRYIISKDSSVKLYADIEENIISNTQSQPGQITKGPPQPVNPLNSPVGDKVEIKSPTFTYEKIADGYYQVGMDQGVNCYFYVGENSVLKKETKYYYAENPYAKINDIVSFDLSNIGTQPVLININISGEYFVINDKTYYSYTEEYLHFPPKKDPPIGRIVFTKSQISQNGFTLNGDPIITGASKGNVITETYLDKIDPTIKSGTIDTDNGYLITSVSKSNPRFINNSLYYNYTISKHEITQGTSGSGRS